jgi:hypothetical protein
MSSESQKFFENKHNFPDYTFSLFQEIKNSLNKQKNPINNAIKAINEFHGPFNGVSRDFVKKLNLVASRDGTTPTPHDIIQQEEYLFLKRVEILENMFANTKTISNTSELAKIREFVYPQLQEATSNFIDILNDTLIGVYESNDLMVIEDADLILSKTLYIESINTPTKQKIDSSERLFFSVYRANDDSISDDARILSDIVLDTLYNADVIIKQILINERNDLNSQLKKKNEKLRTQSKNATKAVENLEKTVAEYNEKSTRYNKTFGADMDTLTLRDFVKFSQNIHPAVTNYINKNISQYPYFQKISESVGSIYYTFTMASSLFDPMSSVLADGQWNTKTCSLMKSDMYKKNFLGSVQCAEYATGLLDSMYHRCSGVGNNLGLLIPDYAQGDALAHGLSMANDVFHKQRLLDVKDAAYATLVGMFGDRLRLLNQFFPTRFIFKNENKLYNVNGVTVDRSGRTYTPRHINNNRVLGYSEEVKNERI